MKQLDTVCCKNALIGRSRVDLLHNALQILLYDRESKVLGLTKPTGLLV